MKSVGKIERLGWLQANLKNVRRHSTRSRQCIRGCSENHSCYDRKEDSELICSHEFHLIGIVRAIDLSAVRPRTVKNQFQCMLGNVASTVQ